jgi:GNAT superfamily N-acetyltransferase
MRERWVRSDGAIYVADVDHHVVAYGRAQFLAEGVVPAEPALPVGFYLLGIVVADDHRRSGIGRALCEARVAWVTERADDTWYFTNITNTASRSLHAAVGFAEVHTFESTELDGGRGVLGHLATRGCAVGQPVS